MKRIFSIAIISLFVLSCGEESDVRTDGYSSAKNPEDSLFQEVMNGHDEAMAKMGRIAGYRKQMDSLKKQASAKAGLKAAYEQSAIQLKNAEDRMNKWMDEFSIDSAQDNTEKRMQYLSNEKLRVDSVRDEIFAALKSADTLLNKK